MLDSGAAAAVARAVFVRRERMSEAFQMFMMVPFGENKRGLDAAIRQRRSVGAVSVGAINLGLSSSALR
jgi:hypothetical protein